MKKSILNTARNQYLKIFSILFIMFEQRIALNHDLWKKNQIFFEFLNIFADEIKQLKEKIEIFNIQIIIINNHIINIFDDEKIIFINNAKLFLIIANYIEAVNNDFYNEINSIFCILIFI